MRAVVFEKVGGPEVLKIAEVPKPEVKPGTVLIKVRAAGINFADTLFRQGQWLFEKSLKVSGFVLYTVAAVPEVMRRGIEESLRLITEKKVRIVIGKTFPLAQAAEAHRFMESRQSVGKLVLVP